MKATTLKRFNDMKSHARMGKKERRIAYFSMEIGIDSRIPSYSGGLGILAGDTIQSCADLNVPLVAVTLLYKKRIFLSNNRWRRPAAGISI